MQPKGPSGLRVISIQSSQEHICLKGIVNLTGKEEFGVETDTDLEGMSRASGLVPELKRFAEQLAITVC